MTQFHDLAWWWKAIRRITLTLGVLLSLFAIGEVLRLYLTLREVHPWLGWGFLGGGGVALTWLTVAALRGWRSRPRVLPDAPRLAKLEEASPEELRQYRRALLAHGRRFLGSEAISTEESLPAPQQVERLHEGLAEALPGPSLIEEIRVYEEQILRPVLARLDALAEKEIRESTADIITAVTISPWRSADLMIVIARSTGMVLRISWIYGSRPSLRGQLAVLKDVLKIVATVNLVGLGQRFIERLFTGIPFVGGAVDDLIQGFGAGYYANLAGHAARERCRSIQRWELREVEPTLLRQMSRFASDLRKWLATDLGQGLWHRLTRKLGGSGSGRDRELEDLRKRLDSLLAEMDDPEALQRELPKTPEPESWFGKMGRWFGV